MPDDLHEVVAGQLRRVRQRYTTGRRTLITTLHTFARPVTATELIDADAASSISSLYRNLSVLEQCGAVRRVVSHDDSARYELSEALSEHHHHVVCSQCGTVADITLPVAIEDALHEAGLLARSAHGFHVDGHHLELIGWCAQCSQEQRSR
jgi:Fur family transcriptional regulator, ferric uptake regulator